MSLLTLIASWGALKRGTQSSTATQLGVAFNLSLIVAGLVVFTAIWRRNAADGLLLLWIDDA
jgi:hypothetical protein